VAYTRPVANPVPAGGLVDWNGAAAPAYGAAFSTLTGAGVVTFTQAGAYLAIVQLGVQGGCTFALSLDGATTPQLLAWDPGAAAGLLPLLQCSYLLAVQAGQTLSLVNVGVAPVATQVVNGQGQLQLLRLA